MGKIKKSLGIIYGIIVVLVAIVLGAYLLYGEQLGQMYERYFGSEEQVQKQEPAEEPEVAPEDERPPRSDEPAEEEPADEREPTEEPAGDIEIESRYPGKIVYTTDTGQDAAPYRADCEERGGTFNECGSTCGPDADFCVQVCAYTCENIPTDDGQPAADEEPAGEPAEEPAEEPLGAPEPGTETYTSENFGVSFSFPSDMEVEKQNGRLRVYKWGPTQREGTELYDGIIITLMKPENPDDMDLMAFAEQQLENELQFEGEVVEPVTRVRHGEFTGYEFTVTGLGISTSFFFENEEDEIIRVVYFVEDPGNLGFEETLNEILDSLESL
jgi:hypothetical protein